MGMAMARGFWLVAVAASCFCICLKPPLWEATPNPPIAIAHGTQCAWHYVLRFVPPTHSLPSLLVCLHLRIIDACRDAILGPAMSGPLDFGPGVLGSNPGTGHTDRPLPPVLLPVSGCWSLVAADNNNSGELRAGWEMPLICWSCQLSRSEMKWKSHALMAEMLSPGGRGLPVGPPYTHSCPKKNPHGPAVLPLLMAAFYFFFSRDWC